MKALYTASVTAHEGREGHVKSSDANLEVDLRVLSVELDEQVEQVEGPSAEEALVRMHAAHEVCPYPSATRGNIDVRLSSH